MSKAENIKNAEVESTQSFFLPKDNYKFIAIGLAIIVVGLFLMSGGGTEDPTAFSEDIFSFRRITLAPIVMLAGFGFEIWAIMRTPKTEA